MSEHTKDLREIGMLAEKTGNMRLRNALLRALLEKNVIEPSLTADEIDAIATREVAKIES